MDNACAGMSACPFDFVCLLLTNGTFCVHPHDLADRLVIDRPPIPPPLNARVSGNRDAHRDPSQSTGSGSAVPVRKYLRQTKLGNSSGRRKRVDEELSTAPTGMPSTADVILSYVFKTNYTRKPLMDFTTSENNWMCKWTTAHSKYKALAEAFCEIRFEFGDEPADLGRGLSAYDSSIVLLHDRGGRGTAVTKSRANLKCLQTPRGKGSSIETIWSMVRASSIRLALDRLKAASEKCTASGRASRSH